MVPDEVGIVGLENWEAVAIGSRPPLSTVDLNVTELGQVAATTLLEVIDGRAPLSTTPAWKAPRQRPFGTPERYRLIRGPVDSRTTSRVGQRTTP